MTYVAAIISLALIGLERQTMKLLLLILLLPGIAAAAITGTNAFDLAPVINTTANGQAIAITNVNIPARTFLIQNTGITGQVSSVSGTNSMKVNVQFSFDAANWTTITTYNPSRTNATMDAFSPNLSRVTVYMRAQVVTTNTVTTAVTATQP